MTLRKNILAMVLLSCTIASSAQQKNGNMPKPVDPQDIKPIGRAENVVSNSIYADINASADERTIDLIRRMTFDEKLSFTGGGKKFMTPEISRLGIRPVSMADASQGIRTKTTVLKHKTTSFPCMIALASTWNPELAAEISGCISEECRALGVDILLGPGINMQRISAGGRNFEYMGEDPFLTAAISTEYIKGLQKEGIIATAKHFICNDQDFCRHIADSEVDERTLREIYLVPFEKAIKEGGLKAVMTGNNLVNGIPCSMHKPLLEDILRREYGFRGIVMTDWQNTYYFTDRQNLVLCSGQSLLMPENKTFREYVKKEIARSPERKAEIEALIEKMIYPNIYTLFESGILDREFNIPSFNDKTEGHRSIAAECVSEAIILLKNSRHILPLEKGQSILLTGTPELHSGTGSGFVEGYDHITYEDGIRNLIGNDLICEEKPEDNTIRKADVVLFRLNKPSGEGRDIPFEDPAEEIAALEHVLSLNRNVVVLVSSGNPMPMEWAEKAKGIVWCNFLGQERGNELAALLYGKKNFSGKLPYTIEKSFKDSPAPEYNYIGGKPYWIGNNQYRNYWKGIDTKPVEGFSDFVKPGETVKVPYSEGLFMGYRWYDREEIPVMYPFGFGLSYTEYEYEAISSRNRMEEEGKVYVDVTVRNTGRMAGKEIVQLYVSDPCCSVERPVKELKGFTKVSLEPGESKTVTITLDSRSFSFWDEGSHSWKLENGEFILKAGPASSILPLQQTISL